MAKLLKKRTRAGQAKTDPIALLDEVARNLWWTWNSEAIGLFEYADERAFRNSDGNPIVTLRELSPTRRRALGADTEFAAEVARVHARFQRYLKEPTWYQAKHGKAVPGRIAYFCMEYGLHESLPLYAGGLGILAGDHLKSASDLGLPLVAIGIYWKKGYTRQRIDEAGCQQDRFPLLPLPDTPCTEVLGRGGKPLRIALPMGDEKVAVAAYIAQVGRIPLYLLSTDLPENPPRHRKLCDVLYSGDRDSRIRQEILLGIGGCRLLRSLRIPVSVYHLNEGHAAFLSLERIAEEVEGGAAFRKAVSRVAATSVFTTHTPVPAGNEEFDPHLVDRYMARYPTRMGVTPEVFHDLARVRPGKTKENFGMTPLALRTSRHCNGVAALHGEVARKMWRPLYPGRSVEKVPIGHVTNGIHLRTWLHPEMEAMLDEFLGEDWEHRQDDAKTWKAVAHIPDEALWDLHQSFKRELIGECTDRQSRAGRRKGAAARPPHPEALTLGFARRFAPYKRAALIFSDPDRLARILCDRERPVQILFAGKAHPADTGGKDIIREVVRFSRSKRFQGRVIFLEDYEMAVARRMVAGVDVWLNTPQRPREASGTSGMKPAVHGGLNLSILDGWWPEGYNGKNGWAIGKGENWTGPGSDARDAGQLYRLLEREVVPLFYDRDPDGLPRRWIACMKAAILSVPHFFNSHRQVKEYLAKYYLPAMRKAGKS